MESLTKYWCFICKKETSITENNNELECDICKSTFVEEIEDNTNGDNHDELRRFIPQISPSGNNSNLNLTNNTRGVFNYSSGPTNIHIQIMSPGMIVGQTANPISILNPLLNTFQQGLSLFNNNSLLSFNNTLNSLENNNFNHILNLIMQNDPNKYGNPPAAKKVIESLPRIKINSDNLSEYSDKDCLVCMDSVQLENITIKLKCLHYFHEQCIVDWLKVHNTCPVCREEYPTDDVDFENRKSKR